MTLILIQSMFGFAIVATMYDHYCYFFSLSFSYKDWVLHLISLFCLFLFLRIYSFMHVNLIFGPSGVRALTLAAGINVGGHYK